jgi:hypothetical protein
LINFKNKDIGLIWDSLDKNLLASITQLIGASDSKATHLKLKIEKLNEIMTKIREAKNE